MTHHLTRDRGRLDASGVHRWLTEQPPAPEVQYYLCGPEALMDEATTALTKYGVPADRVHRETYASAAEPTTVVAPQEMVVEGMGSVVVEPGQTMLDAGLAAGLPMPFSCTVGSCGDCMVKLKAGDVAMSEPNCLTPEQRADGYILTCVGCPLAPVIVRLTDR
ncbi:flavin reductase family protein [Kribbella antibiotica]|uniref:flavin reductase family protein n=1 Tax=Kribbella antibiotica TaxID=190195 RepID=UPI00192D845E|nr:iron-sulfur cluster-binding domain-containing protein [Kribbella antibiotica]